MPARSSPGRSLVTRRAIVDLVRNATLGSYGVTGFAAGVPERLLGRLGFGQPGVRVQLEPAVSVELELTIAHGLPIAEVARQVDSSVRYSIRRSLGIELARLTIHVDGLEVRPAATPPAGSAGQPGPVDLDALAGSGTDVA